MNIRQHQTGGHAGGTDLFECSFQCVFLCGVIKADHLFQLTFSSVRKQKPGTQVKFPFFEIGSHLHVVNIPGSGVGAVTIIVAEGALIGIIKISSQRKITGNPFFKREAGAYGIIEDGFMNILQLHHGRSEIFANTRLRLHKIFITGRDHIVFAKRNKILG